MQSVVIQHNCCIRQFIYEIHLIYELYNLPNTKYNDINILFWNRLIEYQSLTRVVDNSKQSEVVGPTNWSNRRSIPLNEAQYTNVSHFVSLLSWTAEVVPLSPQRYSDISNKTPIKGEEREFNPSIRNSEINQKFELDFQFFSSAIKSCTESHLLVLEPSTRSFFSPSFLFFFFVFHGTLIFDSFHYIKLMLLQA